MVKRYLSKGVWKGLLLFLVIACFANFNLVSAQESTYPEKPIEMVVSFGPGGVVDICVRVIVERLSQELGVPVVIRNKGGAGGMIGAAEVLKVGSDGYTLLASSSGAMTSAPIESANPPYDPLRDFLPICGYGVSPMIFGVQSSSPFKSLTEVVAYAKKNPGKLTCGVTSIGGENHLNFELFRKASGADIKIVPYRGTGQAIAALLGGHIDMMVLTYVGFLPYVNSGQTRILAITKKFPGSAIPTISEVGYPEVRMHILLGFWCTSKVSKEIYDKLISAFETVMKDPEIAKKLESKGVLFEYKGASDFETELKERWAFTSNLVEQLGLKKK